VLSRVTQSRAATWSCMTCGSRWSPSEAGQVAALDAASAGRAYLGLARGAWLGAIGITRSRPLRRLREAAAVARALLAGDETGFTGQEFRLEPGARLRAAPPWRRARAAFTSAPLTA
jgi:alkanesulfonate monooxygenase SsuD/methylene tetrahydromethanopterin reductase-like flavin-dependent oxidoreductase (luciferase family)